MTYNEWYEQTGQALWQDASVSTADILRAAWEAATEAALVAERGALRDAERYRWWRLMCHSHTNHDGTLSFSTGLIGIRGRTFDDAIDEAMQRGHALE